MAARSVSSPGGSLLRSSRIFSIPPPLPKPTSNLSSTAVFGSDTATLPHPTHLSITTPQSSLARGDWGFKRPLPLRSTTRTSTPIIRVESIDTFEHVTTFGSAADHSLTLQKWQEMGVPITTPPVMKKSIRTTNFNMSESEGTNKSVFEDEIDSTVFQERGLFDKDDTRWKYRGPWLAGLTEGEFNTYIQSQIRGRKPEFREFLRTACAEKITRERRRVAGENGDTVEQVQASDVTDAELDAFIKTLREDLKPLYNLLRKFLDLPPSPNRNIVHDLLGPNGLGKWKPSSPPIHVKSEDFQDSNSPYADTGPPKTHPSAGLGYSRSSSYLYNHPSYGPQKHKPPVQARVLMPKGAPTGNFGVVLGVGGFAVATPPNEPQFDTRGFKGMTKRSDTAGLLNIEPDKVGGSKYWVQPKSASIDPQGRVKLLVASAEPEAIAIKQGKAHEIPARDTRNQSLAAVRSSFAPIRRPTTSDASGDYGIGPADFKQRGDKR